MSGVSYRSLLVTVVLVGCAGDGLGTLDDPGTTLPPGPGTTEVPFECGAATDAGGFNFVKVGTWKHDATAAYTLVHDDLCDWSVRGIAEYAIPELNERGLQATMATVAGTCDMEGTWDQVGMAEDGGHEIANHSYDHSQIEVANGQLQITDAKALLDQHTSEPVSFFVFPYDYFTDDTINQVGSAGHMGARAGNRDDNDAEDNPPINGSAPQDDLEVEFDVFPRAYSKYVLYTETDMLWVHAWNAIEAGGWAMREFHSVIEDGDTDINGFGPIELTPYREHLDNLADARDKNYLWVANASEVLRYRHARDACGVSLLEDTLSFDTSNPDCTNYATPISVVVTTGNDIGAVQGLQGGDPVVTKKLSANTYAITADPTEGPVVLSGCAELGPAVISGTIRPRPEPAESVCDLEMVVGTGSPGDMDDLERPPEDLQVLPNPSQADGRTGSWSWYPQDASVEITDDGGNSVLRYSAGSLNAWTGVTLAFLGGNGAGTCYDGSAYTGVRFKIKGTVNSTDALAGQVIMSMVTAETQSQLYGGDLDGQGGHYHKIIQVPPNWQTISVPFWELSSPTWGDTLSLTAFNPAKLQSIDWGVTDQHTSFDIQLDDIELY